MLTIGVDTARRQTTTYPGLANFFRTTIFRRAVIPFFVLRSLLEHLIPATDGDLAKLMRFVHIGLPTDLRRVTDGGTGAILSIHICRYLE